jgi:hypothetical protein
MQRTTSITNYYALAGTNQFQPMTIRVPKHLKVFRAHIFCDNREDITADTSVFISTQFPGNFNNGGVSTNGIFLTSRNYTEASVPVAPDVSTGYTNSNVNSVIFDRRGVGYMCDDFYIYGKGGISIIWEGIIEE